MINWVLKRNGTEKNFDEHKEFRLEMLNRLAKRGLDLPHNSDIAGQSILERCSFKIVQKLLDLGASLDVNEKIKKYNWDWKNHPLLYWIVDRDGVWESAAFEQRIKNDFPLMKLLIQAGPTPDGDDIMRQALWGRHSEEMINYLLEHRVRLRDEYHEGILKVGVGGIERISALRFKIKLEMTAACASPKVK